MDVPTQHRTRLHSTNVLERLDGEVKRRADVVGVFPNAWVTKRIKAGIRLIGTPLPEANDDGPTRHRYMQTEAMAGLVTPSSTSSLHGSPP